MDSGCSSRVCALYHVARARLLVDCLADSPRVVTPQTLEVTLRMITAELALTQGVLERPRA